MSSALPLPRLVVVADSGAARGRPLVDLCEQALAGGAGAIWLREKMLPPTARRHLVGQLVALARAHGALVVSSARAGSELADGCHLGAVDPWPAGWARGQMVGRSCHSAADLEVAAAEGCRWASLSPVFPSLSKPGYGPVVDPRLLSASPLPTWALGGVGPGNAARCLAAGAAGVMVMGAVMGAERPADAVAGILASLAGAAA